MTTLPVKLLQKRVLSYREYEAMKQLVSWKNVPALACVILYITAGCILVSGDEIPEYIGSQACLACHAEKYVSWKSSDHAHMVMEIINFTELPLELDKAPADLQSELRKAEYFVAGTFFIARDPNTQHYRLLNVTYDGTLKEYRPSDINLNWSTACSGCHVTNMNTHNLTWGEAGIGCEACHGPGREHALNGGDVGKIVSSKESDICGQCHGGNDGLTGGNMMSDGTKWVVGFRPGMILSQIDGLQLTPVDPEKIPPDADLSVNHLRNYNMWKASGHAKALTRIINNEHATAECYGCHSAEGLAAKLQDKTVDLNQKDGFNTLSCVACHDSHNSDHPHQLIADSQKLCTTCHTQDDILKGRAVAGIEETRTYHSEIECVSCHMTEANHLMKVIRPDDPDLAEERVDSCTTCHRFVGKKSLGAALQNWQSMYSEKMDTLQADLQSIGSAIQSNPDLLAGELKAKYDSARANLMLLTRDGSRGAHNYEYAIKIMNQADKDLDAVQTAIK